MKIQLALDRMSIADCLKLVKKVEGSVDWVEVGTSLIKEYGIKSIREIKKAFPEKVVVADIKTIDNARYEFEMCFRAGADVATVMGVSPLVTIDLCMETARRFNKKVMIDLLNTSPEQKNALKAYKEAIFCHHISKDEQETSGAKHQRELAAEDTSLELAVAGGITLDFISGLKEFLRPSVVIIGSAITKAENPTDAAKAFKQLMEEE